MTHQAQTLRVVIVVSSTLSQWDDVVTLRCQGHSTFALTLRTQGRPHEQRLAHPLQLAPCDPLRRRHRFDPRFLGMLGTSTRAITHQRTTARVTTRSRSSSRHRGTTPCKKPASVNQQALECGNVKTAINVAHFSRVSIFCKIIFVQTFVPLAAHASTHPAIHDAD